MAIRIPSPSQRVPGTVYLVGAGPGDPDLLTLRAARLIEAADLIVHDGLVDASILTLASTNAERISVAKSRSRHTMKQEDINALLVREALAGRDVVRLKGGDPFIFGRGGEEMDACRQAGIRVVVVPGISAAIGCAAQAHMPLTHRHAASAVTFVAGQCQGLSEQDWTGLLRPGRTLVIYMGIASAPQIVAKLIADGAPADLPVAVLEKGTRRDARALATQLDDLADMIVREKIVSPALIVVGEVVRHSDARKVQQQFEAYLETQA